MGAKVCLAQELGEGKGGVEFGRLARARDYLLPTLKKAPNNTYNSR
jgi:hypothetical protein